MDKYYGNVCELDIIFNFQKAYFILDELLLAGEMQESSKKNVLRCIGQQDSLEDMEVCRSQTAHTSSLSRLGSYHLSPSLTSFTPFPRHTWPLSIPTDTPCSRLKMKPSLASCKGIVSMTTLFYIPQHLAFQRIRSYWWFLLACGQ